MAIGASFSSEALKLDCATETEKIARSLREVLSRRFKKRGIVVAMSGGIDSSVVGALCVRALGKERVLGLLMPERDSSEDTLRLSRLITEHLEMPTVCEDITGVLEAVGCYKRRDEAIQSVVPEYGPSYKCKIVLPSVLDDERYRIFSVVVQSPEGEQTKVRLTPAAYLGIVAATNFKQRTRKMLEYYHADRLNYAVSGTPNRQEYDQGFFVKLGDGAADIKPIAHLYKTQVYQMAEFLGVPEEICRRPPTTDTYSMQQSQDEFYFSVPYDKMDLCLYGKNQGVSPGDVAAAAEMTAEQVERVYRDIDAKRNATRYLHTPPLLVDKVEEISS
ncbi:MAG: NAD(+) synthase [Planctomycetes bacterium B3_Pla]|nr:MAG: NAD(+) synthase [Planctomycetes bacterium B3_Pla]